MATNIYCDYCDAMVPETFWIIPQPDGTFKDYCGACKNRTRCDGGHGYPRRREGPHDVLRSNVETNAIADAMADPKPCMRGEPCWCDAYEDDDGQEG